MTMTSAASWMIFLSLKLVRVEKWLVIIHAVMDGRCMIACKLL
jgi:hypothetical protein